MTDELAVTGIECYGHHGVFDFERREGQVFVIDLVLGIGLQVIVEGVESPRCLAILAGTGCHLAQGYHLGRPVPLEALLPEAEMPRAA